MIDAIRSEWIKQSTITVTWVLAIIAAVFPVGITILTAILSDDPPDGLELTELIAGLSIISAMLLGVLGTLAVTNEFSHNTIRPTFAAVPQRLRPLLAKPIVSVALSVLVAVVVVIVAWLVGSALADGEQQLEGMATPALIGLVLLVAGLTLLGFGIGLLVRNSAGSICLLLLWPLVAEGLIAALMAAADKDGWQRWLPYVAGFNLVQTTPDSDSLGRVPGGLYFFAWIVVIIVAGLVRTNRRDA